MLLCPADAFQERQRQHICVVVFHRGHDRLELLTVTDGAQLQDRRAFRQLQAVGNGMPRGNGLGVDDQVIQQFVAVALDKEEGTLGDEPDIQV